MKNLLLFIIYFMAFPIIASAQAKGGQITRKKPKVSKTKKDNNTTTIDFSFKPVVTKPITPKEEIQPISIDRLSFYNIVVCTYSLLSDAQKECQKLRDSGYFSEYFFDSSNTYRVLLYKTTNSEQSAKNYIKNARRIYPNAWIMCVENGRTFRYYK